MHRKRLIYRWLKINKCVLFLLIIHLPTGFYGCSQKNKKPVLNQKSVEITVKKPKLPQSISFCGEKVPIENPLVWELLDREFSIEVWDRGQVVLWFKRSGRYFPFFEEKLRQAGLPDDLKYVSVIESALIPDIGSYQGAKGLWQLMKKTAQSKGLRVDSRLDERRCYQSSTIAALEYFKELYDQFKSWSLVLAAYNCGETQLRNKIKEQKTDDYYNLFLPQETERFVYRIVACKIILENLNQFGFNLDEEEMYKPDDLDFISVNVSNSIRIYDIAEAMGLTKKTFLHYNPQLVSSYLPLQEFSVYIPKNSEETFRMVLQSYSNSSKGAQLKKGEYLVKSGDSLSSISKETGVSIKKLKALNNISGSNIKIGQKIRLE